MTLRKSIKSIDIFIEIKNSTIVAVAMQVFPKKWLGNDRLNIQPWIYRNKPILERNDVDRNRDGRSHANPEREKHGFFSVVTQCTSLTVARQLQFRN